MPGSVTEKSTPGSARPHSRSSRASADWLFRRADLSFSFTMISDVEPAVAPADRGEHRLDLGQGEQVSLNDCGLFIHLRKALRPGPGPGPR